MKCNADAIVIVIKGIGHVPAKKNSKQIIPGRNGRKTMLITKPEYQEWTKRCVLLIESQLYSAMQTNGVGTSTEDLAQFSTLWLPPDDNWTQVEIGCLIPELVAKGEEGAVIVIERNPNPRW